MQSSTVAQWEQLRAYGSPIKQKVWGNRRASSVNCAEDSCEKTEDVALLHF